MMKHPKPLLSPDDVRTCAAAMKGQLDSMIADAGGTGIRSSRLFPAQLHPVVWSMAGAHWTAHQYRVAVREAAEGLTLRRKAKLNRQERHQLLAADAVRGRAGGCRRHHGAWRAVPSVLLLG
jgi:hypothetical protein